MYPILTHRGEMGKRKRMCISNHSVRLWADGQHLSYWLLPGQELPKTVKRFAFDLNNWLAEKFPTPAPLDEL